MEFSFDQNICSFGLDRTKKEKKKKKYRDFSSYKTVLGSFGFLYQTGYTGKVKQTVLDVTQTCHILYTVSNRLISIICIGMYLRGMLAIVSAMVKGILRGLITNGQAHASVWLFFNDNMIHEREYSKLVRAASTQSVIQRRLT